MNKAKQLALGILFDLPGDHPIIKDLLADPEIVALAEIAVIDRNDFFSAQANGRSFFDYPEIWEHMDTAVTRLRSKGVDIRGRDFAAKEWSDKSALSYAFDKSLLQKVFTPVIWDKQFDDMRNAWYGLGTTGTQKDKCDFIKVQEEVAASEGRVSRIAQLKKMGLDISDIRKAVSSGDYASVDKVLNSHGEHFGREDVFVLDNWGDHTLDNSSGWKHFVELWDELAKNGERLEVEDFLFHCADRKSLLKYVESDSDGLKALFTPRLWTGRMDDAIRLYNLLPESARAKVSIDDVVNEIVERDYNARLEQGQVGSRKDIIEPINNADSNKPGFHPVRPLSLKSVWDRIAHVQGLLRQKDESITLDDLRQKSGVNEETCLVFAARYGAFDKVMDIVHASGERLSVDELTQKDKAGKSIVDYLLEHDQLAQILSPDDWLGRGPELARLWQALPEKGRDKMNFQQIIGNLNTISLRQRFSDRLPVPGGP